MDSGLNDGNEALLVHRALDRHMGKSTGAVAVQALWCCSGIVQGVLLDLVDGSKELRQVAGKAEKEELAISLVAGFRGLCCMVNSQDQARTAGAARQQMRCA